MGHVITASGISPDPAIVEAIQNLEVPNDVFAVRRLCGTIQYFSRYIPNLSHHMEPLRALTRKSVTFSWCCESQNAFENTKPLVIENTRLAYFDNNKDLILQVDSSQH